MAQWDDLAQNYSPNTRKKATKKTYRSETDIESFKDLLNFPALCKNLPDTDLSEFSADQVLERN